MSEEVKLVNADDYLQRGGLEPPLHGPPVPVEWFSPAERRVKVLPVGEEHLLTLAYLLSGETPGFISIPRLPNLPAGCKIEWVSHDPIRRWFKILISHPSFDPVPEGMPAPYADEGQLTLWHTYEVERLPVKTQG